MSTDVSGTTTNAGDQFAGRLHRPSVEHMLIATQQQLSATENALAELVELARIRNRPAQVKTIRLSAVSPKTRDEVGPNSLSIAVLNPTDVIVYLGIGGAIAEPGREAISVPPKSFLVLPVAVDDFELGIDKTDPDLGANTAVVFVFRFDSVQQPYLGVMP